MTLVEVYTANDEFETLTVVGLLETAGLDVRVRDLRVTPYPVTLGALGERRIVVPEEEAGHARDLLRRAKEDGLL